MSDLKSQMNAAEEEWLDGWKSGPKRTRWSKIPLQVGDIAPDYELLNSKGVMVNLKSIWQAGPALILFWRHYGCGCGMDRAKRLKEEYPEYLKMGTNLVIIGQGEPEQAAAYAEKYELPEVPILCDTDYKVYFGYGLLEGKESQILFDAPEIYQDRDQRTGEEFAKERKEDDRPLVDNAWLLPGEFVVDTNGRVRLAYRYNYCEDFPDHRVHLAAIREAKLGAGEK